MSRWEVSDAQFALRNIEHLVPGSFLDVGVGNPVADHLGHAETGEYLWIVLGKNGLKTFLIAMIAVVVR